MNTELTKIEDGIYINESGEEGPENLIHDSIKLTRFMDVFYISRPCEELDKTQVISLCQARHDHIEVISYSDANRYVKSIIRKFCSSSPPKRVLELGAGYTPTFEPDCTKFEVLVSDFDQSVVDKNRENGYQSYLFNERNTLPLAENHISIVISVFVLHFNIFDSQVHEIKRLLDVEGILIGNVYLREPQSKNNLEKQFESCGLFVNRIPDDQEHCRGNEFWLIAKSPGALQRASKGLLDILDS